MLHGTNGKIWRAGREGTVRAFPPSFRFLPLSGFLFQWRATMEPRDFEHLVDAHYADLYRFALSLARNEGDACDLTQQTFAIFARKGDEIREPGKRKSWLFTTLYREFLRQGARSRRIVSMDEVGLEDHAAPAPDDGARSAERAEMLEALESLDEPQRAILVLFYLNDHSYKEIAEVLSLPLGTVMSRLARAKEALRARLQEFPRKGINPGG